MIFQRLKLAAFVSVLWGAGACRAHAEPSEADKQLLATVAARCFEQAHPRAEAVEGYDGAFALAQPGVNWAWPPLVALSGDKEVNANARITFVAPGEKPVLDDEPNVVWIDIPGHEPKLHDGEAGAGAQPPRQSDQPAGTYIQPVLCFKQGYMDEIIRGQEGPLAGTFGHELCHLLLGHTFGGPRGTALVQFADSRQREGDADELGVILALRAKFDYDAIVAGARLEREEGYRCAYMPLKKSSGSFAGLTSTHPGWNDRLALIDSRQREMWRSADAFENGVYYLMTEQYPVAIKCFESVTKKYPQCYEAWANKGYAELMMFCDGLEPDDLRQFDIGQLVVGGFYPRPQSLTRGVDEELWFEAVGDLRQALLLKPDLVMAKANLAVAWLVRPAGKDTGKAEKLFQEVFAALKDGHYDEEIEPLVHASLLINAGVAENAHGDPAAAEKLFNQAREVIAENSEASGAGGSLSNAIRFNQARILASRSEPAPQKSAIAELEAYLASSSPAATWWTLAYEEYEKLCAKQSVQPKARDELAAARNTRFRPVSGVTLADGKIVSLNEPVTEFVEALGEGQKQSVVEGTVIHRRRYPNFGLDLHCTHKVLAIRLQGKKAPPLVLKASGPSQQSYEIRPGMSVAALDEILGGDANKWDRRYGTSGSIIYRFYYNLGFGVRLADEKTVMEILVAQLPDASKAD